MKCIQGMIVTAPKDGNELKNLLFTATSYSKGPFSIRYPKESSINFDNTNSNIIKIGSWEVMTTGKDVLILAVGSMVKRSMNIVQRLKEKNIETEVINCRFIKPMDLEYLNNNFSRFSKIVTIEEGVLDGGFGEGVTAWSSSKNLKNDILNIGLPNDFVDHGPRNVLLEEVGLDSQSLYIKIIEFFNE
jgi:1-deoxy-D-xylulose-5-phosphate synthase